jgi:hypothetical protein
MGALFGSVGLREDRGRGFLPVDVGSRFDLRIACSGELWINLIAIGFNADRLILTDGAYHAGRLQRSR